MRTFKFWLLGLMVIIIFFALGKVVDSIGGYQIERIGLNAKYISLALWVIPLAVAFVVTRYSMRWIGLPGLSYLVLIPVIAVIFNWINELSGIVVDFSGWKGALVIFEIVFVYSFVPIFWDLYLELYLRSVRKSFALSRLTDFVCFFQVRARLSTPAATLGIPMTHGGVVVTAAPCVTIGGIPAARVSVTW